MVYECPQCKTPLPPGVMACAKCGLQFATAIPADATVPAPGMPPLISSVTAGYPSPAGDDTSSRRVALTVAALGVVLVAAVLFAIYTFSHTPAVDAPISAPIASTPPLSTGTAQAARIPSAAPAGSLAPVQLSAGTGSSSGAAEAAGGDTALQGRWQAKNMDFYVFNSDGSGSRGNATNPAKTDTFTWVVTNNQLVLNAKKEERLTFSTGPDGSILYLRMPDGRYVKYTHVGTS